jgi:hypothetical protein
MSLVYCSPDCKGNVRFVGRIELLAIQKMDISEKYSNWNDEFDGIGMEGPETLRLALAKVEGDHSDWIACFLSFVLKAEFNKANALAMLTYLPELRERVPRCEGDSDAEVVSLFVHGRLMGLPAGFLELDRDKIHAYVKENQVYCEERNDGYGVRALQDARDVMLDMGHYEASASYHQTYKDRRLTTDGGYCQRCQKEVEKNLSYAYRTGDFEAGLDLWLEMKRRSYYRCATQDDCLGYRLHAELYLLGELENWEELQEAMERLRLNETHRDEDVYSFLIRGRRWERALKVFANRVSFFHERGLCIPAFNFFLDSILLMEQLQAEGRTELNLVTEGELPFAVGRTNPALNDVQQWLHSQAESLAQKLDIRNGTDHYKKLMHEALCEPHLLPPGQWESLMEEDLVLDS